MENRNKIKLTKRVRQTGATTELVAKFFGDKDSCLIVQNHMIKDAIILNHLDKIFNNELKEDLTNRILVFGKNNLEKELEKYTTWYLDVCSISTTKYIFNKALLLDKSLIGHYGDESWNPNEN